MREHFTTKITTDEFVSLMLDRVPEARDVYREHIEDYDEVLLHLLVADLLRLCVKMFHSAQIEPLNRLLAVAETGLQDGDAYVNNAVAVSFVEHIGAGAGESEEFIALWPAALIAERDRQINWSPRGDEISFREFRSAFGDDPMDLPDGEIVGSSSKDWQGVLDALHIGPWQLSLVGDVVHAVPRLADDLPPGFILQILAVGRVVVRLYDWETVGFDVDLRTVSKQADVNALTTLMRTIGSAADKSVILSQEGELGKNPVVIYDLEADTVKLLPIH